MEDQEFPMQVSAQPEATPLEFTVEVYSPHELELDTVLETWREVEGVGEVAHMGVVDAIGVGQKYRGLVRVVRIFPRWRCLRCPVPSCRRARRRT